MCKGPGAVKGLMDQKRASQPMCSEGISGWTLVENN